MPCKSDYLEPNRKEIEGSKVRALLEELRTGTLPSYYGRGLIGNRYYDGDLDEDVQQLCKELQPYSVKDLADQELSLELQMWWRDHQKADAERVLRELQALKKQADRKAALDKLTPYERKLLGV